MATGEINMESESTRVQLLKTSLIKAKQQINDLRSELHRMKEALAESELKEAAMRSVLMTYQAHSRTNKH